MDKPDLLLDLDGVARNFIAGALPIVKEVTGRDHHHDEVNQWRVEHALGLTSEETKLLYGSIASEGWCRSLPLYVGAKEGVAALREVVNVYPVTFQYPSLWWVRECEEWLADQLSINPNDVIHTNAKHMVFGDFFVEDKTAALVTWREKWAKRGLFGVPIQFQRKYNENDTWDGARVTSWPELTSFVISHLASSKR
jgi:5'(3')-deoxyribonucleotidase